MIWVIIIGGIILVAAISSAGQKVEDAQKAAQADVLMDRRVRAYADYIKRTGASGGMTDNELCEEISTAMRAYKRAEDGAAVFPVILFFLAAGIALLLGLGDGNWSPFLPLVVGGYFAADALYKRATRKIAATYTEQGWDPERLRIEA